MKPSDSTNYRITILILGIVLSVPAVFYGTTAQMVQVWIVNETFTHGLLVFPISCWLIWRQRQVLSQLTIEPEPRVLALLLPALFFWFLADSVDVQVAKQAAMVSLVPIALWLLFGRRILSAVLVAVLFLFFSIPIGQSLIPPMMDFTANFTVLLIKLTGVPVYQDGLFFVLPSGSWSVVEECSGVRYLIATLVLSTIYSHLSYSILWKKLAFIGAAIIVPVIANGLRAFGIVMIGHLSGMKLAVGVDHLIYGWVFFGLIILLMFYVGSFWADPVLERTGEYPAATSIISPGRQPVFLSLVAILVASVVLTKSLAYQARQHDSEPVDEAALQFPQRIDSWQRQPGGNIGWSPERLTPDIDLERVYRFGNNSVQLNVAYYSYQRDGAEAVSSQNRVTNPYVGNWKLTRSDNVQIGDIQVTESEIRYGGEKILVWRWYLIGHKQTSSPYVAKFFNAYNNIVEKRRDGSMITIATRLETLKESRGHLQAFYIASISEIRNSLDDLSGNHSH